MYWLKEIHLIPKKNCFYIINCHSLFEKVFNVVNADSLSSLCNVDLLPLRNLIGEHLRNLIGEQTVVNVCMMRFLDQCYPTQFHTTVYVLIRLRR